MRKNNLKNWDLVNFCEFDKYAIKSYCAIHGVDESLNLGDITKVDETKLKDFNMMTWGFPCTDISVAGKQKGFLDEDGNKTRSGMYYEGIRILRYKKPALSIIENVKNLTSKRFKKEFETVLSDLDEAGYNSYYKVLNAKDFGVPQNRERVFIISIRKDLDNSKFVFPEGFDNDIRLKDVLEDEVDEKYYISDDKVRKFLDNLKPENICENTTLKLDGNNFNQRCVVHTPNDFCRTIIGSGGSGGYHAENEPKVLVNQSDNVVKQVGNISDCGGNWKNPQVGRIYSTDGCSPILNTCGGGSHESKIVQVGKLNSSQDGIVVSGDGIAPTHTAGHGNTPKVLETPDYSYCIDANYYKGTTIEQYVDKHRRQLISENSNETTGKNDVIKVGKTTSSNNKSHQKDDVISLNGISTTLLSTDYKQPKQIYLNDQSIRIRKLTPKECFRLMGFSDKDYYASKTGSRQIAQEILDKYPHQGKRQMDEVERISRMSNTQLYKQSGNSIVVDVLYYILVELYKAMPYLFDDLKLSSFFSGIGAFECALNRLYESINTGNFTKPQAD